MIHFRITHMSQKLATKDHSWESGQNVSWLAWVDDIFLHFTIVPTDHRNSLKMPRKITENCLLWSKDMKKSLKLFCQFTTANVTWLCGLGCCHQWAPCGTAFRGSALMLWRSSLWSMSSSISPTTQMLSPRTMWRPKTTWKIDLHAKDSNIERSQPAQLPDLHWILSHASRPGWGWWSGQTPENYFHEENFHKMKLISTLRVPMKFLPSAVMTDTGLFT